MPPNILSYFVCLGYLKVDIMRKSVFLQKIDVKEQSWEFQNYFQMQKPFRCKFKANLF
jgi:hypothetical protein